MSDMKDDEVHSLEMMREKMFREGNVDSYLISKACGYRTLRCLSVNVTMEVFLKVLMGEWLLKEDDRIGVMREIDGCRFPMAIRMKDIPMEVRGTFWPRALRVLGATPTWSLPYPVVYEVQLGGPHDHDGFGA